MGSKDEVSYGSVVLAPLLLQDDALRLTTTVEGARDGCMRFEKIMGSKALEVNTDKSVYLLSCKRKNLERIRAEIARTPLQYKGSKIKEKSTEKWLGSIINSAGTYESSISTISDRKFRIYNIINETIAIIEDCRFNKLGGLKCAKDIWELAIIPSLLNNSELFSIDNPKIQKLLEDFQSTLYRGLLALPKSCPLPALTYESNLLLMKYRVYSKLINFVKHVHCQSDETSLAKQILTEQLLNKWPGTSQQAENICEDLNISGLFNQDISKKQFKATVRKACQLKNDEELKSQIQSYKKMSALREEIKKGNCYFFSETIFRFRVELYESKLNFKNKPEFKADNFLCDSCETEVDHHTHVLYCPAYSVLREDKNLNSDSDLAIYLQNVLDIRNKLRLNK